jgi:hypothetical protein
MPTRLGAFVVPGREFIRGGPARNPWAGVRTVSRRPNREPASEPWAGVRTVSGRPNRGPASEPWAGVRTVSRRPNRGPASGGPPSEFGG